ncbi:MAG: GNAT family N-acetyltransferase [Candidatus Thermoplasmatota archaeon]|nr:GNAT family N-acetyltransferase [Candidatus Thermoplasmatota archaeon]
MAYDADYVEAKEALKTLGRGARIFIGSGAAEPQYLVKELTNLADQFYDTEIFHIQTLGVAPYTEDKFEDRFRHNAFFVDDNTREAVATGRADYTPIFMRDIPKLFKNGRIPLDASIIQVSPPDDHGWMSYGIAVDIISAAVKNSKTVIAQVNPQMPRVHGDAFIHVDDVDYLVHHEEELLEFDPIVPTEKAEKIANNVSPLIENGATLQVGYGEVPNAILSHLEEKEGLGIHTEMLSEDLANLIQEGVVTNKNKTLHPGKSIASFLMGTKKLYDFVDDNPEIELHPTDYTNDPFTIAKNYKMTAINTALQVDLTGQVCADSLGYSFYSGIGGHADFMRGAGYADDGKSIIALSSTAQDGEVSRIVPSLDEGAGVVTTRGDVEYVVTEYGVAYLKGKNIRQRVMELINIAHPKFRDELLTEAKEHNLVYEDQMLIVGEGGRYPDEYEDYRELKGKEYLFRPMKATDDELLKDLFYSLSDESRYKRFMSARKDMPHERRQEFVQINYNKEMALVVIDTEIEGPHRMVGVGDYRIKEGQNVAEVSLMIRDEYQNKGIGTALLEYLTMIAQDRGLYGFTAEVLADNRKMIHVFEKMGYDIDKRREGGEIILKMRFK